MTKAELGEASGDWVAHKTAKPGRIILYLHPGGYVAGGPRYCHQFAGRISERAAARCLVPAYRLAPEHPFPAALDDALAAYRAVLAAGNDPRQFAVGGASAGAGLAVAVALAARERGLPLPAALFLLSPWVDLSCETARREVAADGEMASTDEDYRGSRRDLAEYSAECASHYLAGTDSRSPLASPLFADLSSLPPTHIEVSSTEVLVGDSRALARRAAAAGAEVTVAEADIAVHSYPQNAPDSPDGKAALERIGRHLDRHVVHASHANVINARANDQKS